MVTPSTCEYILKSIYRRLPIVCSGPNWIHGTDDNPILDIANETKSIACSVGEVSETFDEHGQVIKRSKSNELSELMWGIIADAFKYSNGSPDISPNKSLRDFFVEQLAEKDLSSANKKLLLQMSELWGGFVGDHVEHQSLKYFWLEECIDGGELASRSMGMSLTECREPLPLEYLQGNFESDSRARIEGSHSSLIDSYSVD